MVTILKPLHRKSRESQLDITSENLPGNEQLSEKEGQESESGQEPKGVELGRDDSTGGTGSAPGEGPNPTA
ncbi:MAG: hypothetical protein JWL63_1778 [Rhodocyclales bacterium]|nr:hypothetical protein [Rhodocyclales bacterium]